MVASKYSNHQNNLWIIEQLEHIKTHDLRKITVEGHLVLTYIKRRDWDHVYKTFQNRKSIMMAKGRLLLKSLIVYAAKSFGVKQHKFFILILKTQLNSYWHFDSLCHSVLYDKNLTCTLKKTLLWFIIFLSIAKVLFVVCICFFFKVIINETLVKHKPMLFFSATAWQTR